MYTILAVAAGGAIGAASRHALNGIILALTGTAFPLGILTINILGSLMMGLMVGIFAHLHEPPETVKLFLTTGILGGFTTFSSFSLDTVLLWQKGEVAQSALYAGASVLLSITALLAGMMLVKAAAP